MGHRLVTGLLVLVLVLATSIRVTDAHEHEHTHAGLTKAIFQLLQVYWDREDLNPTQRPTAADIAEARQGSISEDDCPRYYSHFYNPNTPTLAGSNVEPGDFIDNNCTWTDNPDFVGLPHAEQYFVQQLATDRAAELWNCAIQTYRGFVCTEPTLRITHQPGRPTAFRLLGQVLHLLEDMTSPAHVHNDPHGKAGIQGFGDCVGQDADDFENWGWCLQRFSTQPDADHGHIRDYVAGDSEQMTQHLLNNLQTLFAQSPQGTPGSLDPVQRTALQNPARAFVRHVAELVYNFTTFKVRLQDPSIWTDVQPESELRRMLRGSTNEGIGGINNCGVGTIDTGLCEISGGFTISGSQQEVGFSNGHCGRAEWGLDTNEEWWLMDNGHMGACAEAGHGASVIDAQGFAYIENTGGEGPAGLVDPDSFSPLRYGCGPNETHFCGSEAQSKRLFSRLYGSNANQPGRTMLRIYGDVLYSVAVAYGAGLVQTFIEEVNKPNAVPGGPYSGEACQVLTFDASGSTDQNGGFIVSYDWDFTADGSFDLSTAMPTAQRAYLQPFSGQLRLRVTDNDQFTDEDTAQVTITPDRTPPNLAGMTATPSVLWAPNHKMRDVTLNPNATDACGVASCRIINVTSNEPPNSEGDGNTDSDIEITGDLTLMLRAERSGGSNGRVYHVTVQCTDTNGNSAVRTIAVTVSHSNSKSPNTAIPGRSRRDFDNDGATDLVVFRPTSGSWHVRYSSAIDGSSDRTSFQWGMTGDAPLNGDFDGDRENDLILYRPSTGAWHVRRSSADYLSAETFTWGTVADVPLTADFDGDGRSDLTAYRPSTGTWFIRYSSHGYATASHTAFAWGAPGDIPLPADFDGDGSADLAVYRPSMGAWLIRYSSQSFSVNAYGLFGWGVSTDVPLVADFDGDGKAELTLYRPSTGEWFIRYSSTGYAVANYRHVGWGLNGDRPTTGDFDGDGRADITVYRPSTGQWFILYSGQNYDAGAYGVFQWGVPGDTLIE